MIRNCVNISILHNPKVTGAVPLTFRVQISSLRLMNSSEHTSLNDTPVIVGITDIDSELAIIYINLKLM